MVVVYPTPSEVNAAPDRPKQLSSMKHAATRVLQRADAVDHRVRLPANSHPVSFLFCAHWVSRNQLKTKKK
jgi:hypothetical protein